jgi:hypothetical protein
VLRSVDDFASNICNAEFLGENGIDLPKKGKTESKPEAKKKKWANWRGTAPLTKL